MKPFKLLPIALLFIVWPVHQAKAQWVQTNGPYVTHGPSGALMYCLPVNGKSLFAGTDGCGVFLSTNSGTSWTEVNTGLEDVYVEALAVSGTSVFTGTYSSGSFGGARCDHRYTERKGEI
jgi:hypothetical protein